MAPASPSGEDVPVDLGVLARLMGDPAPETLRLMLANFWESEGGTPLVLREHAAARDAAALAEAAHGARGAASFIGARSAADLCLALERSARAENWSAVAPLLEDVEKAYAAIGAFIASS